MDAHTPPEILHLTAPHGAPLQRLDAYLVPHLPQYSRSRIAEMISDGHVHVNGASSRPSRKLRGGEHISIVCPRILGTPLTPVPMPLTVLYEDEHVLVIDKPPAIAIHPGSGTTQPTLVHGLLHAFPDIAHLEDHERPGIVHRLDKDTSGCLIVARTEAARRALVEMFAARTVHKQYYALVQGVPPEGTLALETTIGRSLRDRTKMAVNTPDGRLACTHATVVEPFGSLACALAVRILTGRTHQIRVHLSYAGFPVIGDATYGKAAREVSRRAHAQRQMLHAHRLSFTHPVTGVELAITSPIPADIQGVAARLRQLCQPHESGDV